MSIPKKRSHSPAPTLGRASFSSIRERDSDYFQAFTSSKVSSYAQQAGQPPLAQHEQLHDHQGDESSSPRHSRPLDVDEVAMVDESASPVASSPSVAAVDAGDASAAATAAATVAMGSMFLSSHHATAEGDVALDRWPGRLDELEGVEDVEMSLDGMSSLHDHAALDIATDGTETVAPKPAAAIERLPLELYRLIVDNLIVDTPPNGIDRRNVDVVSLLATSRPLYAMTLESLYRRVTIPHSRIFQKFRAQLEADNFRGNWVRRLDFSHFSPVSLFSTDSEREAARNLTSETLLRCLDLTPNLHEFLVQDYIDTDINESVLRKLLVGLPSLKALDLCGCSSASFRNAFISLIAGPPPSPAGWPTTLSIQRLSLHKCINLPSSVFEFLMPKLDRLTHLDLTGTHITDAALHSIPRTARITHLNLSKCSLLTADAVINFLTSHPAVTHGSLVFLSLGFNAATSQLLDEENVSRLLPILPKSLKSLSLKGSKMSQEHLPQIRQLSKHLEELAFGRGMTLEDVKSVVIPPVGQDTMSAPEEWVPHSLRYIDLTDMGVDTFDLTYLYIDSHLLNTETAPLEVIEVSEDIFKRVSKSKAALTRVGWRQSEIGARSWLVRGNPPTGKPTAFQSGSFAMENGQRPWKMGAQSWGMRKIPMANAKVGGMYGSYMFGRKL